MKEIWKDIPGYEGLYQVSNLGNVKSLSRIIKHSKGGNKIKKERMLKPVLSTSGYAIITLHKNGSQKTSQIHQLVAMVFLNHIPNGHKLVVDHINDNPFDNCLENLQVITQRENVCKTQGNYSSQYKGVCWNKNRNKWVSRIALNNKQTFLGYFVNEYEAHLKYQETLKNL